MLKILINKIALLLVFLFLCSHIFSKDLNILFIPQDFESDFEELQDIFDLQNELMNFFPLSNYLDYLKFDYISSETRALMVFVR